MMLCSILCEILFGHSDKVRRIIDQGACFAVMTISAPRQFSATSNFQLCIRELILYMVRISTISE